MNDLRKALRWLAAATIGLYLFAAVAVVYVWVDTQRTHSALCTFRGDLEQRVQTSKDFLRTHPAGIPGIPAAIIRQGIKNQQSTIDALQELKC